MRVILSLILSASVIAITGCDSGRQLEADANTLCKAFEPEYLKSRYEGMWLSDVEKEIYDNLKEEISTTEVKGVIASRSAIDNYAQVYPYIKESMENALGASWHCQNMASFYDITFVPDASGEEAERLELRQVNSDGAVFAHDNGLLVAAYLEYETFEKTDEGFIFDFNPEGSRQADYITLELSGSHDIKSAETRTIDGVVYRFKLDEVNVGSGGPEHTLRIWKPLDGSGVFLEHYIQTENVPDFSRSWKLIESSVVQ